MLLRVSFVVYVCLLFQLVNSSILYAAEKTITGEEFRKIVAGKTAVDVARDDHILKLKADGTGTVASRGVKFPVKYRDTNTGWCRELSPPGDIPINMDRFRRVAKMCQVIKYDGELIYFYNENGSLSSRFKVQ